MAMLELQEEQLTVYNPEFFTVEEFVPRRVFEEYGKQSWWFIDTRIVWTADAIRDYFKKPFILNNWYRNGPYQYRGLRTIDSKDYSAMSQHSFGRALDGDVKDVSPDEVRQEIKSHSSDPHFRFITAVEESIDWLHVDCRTMGQDGILFFTK
jgi:hypothetical protein